MPLITSTHFMKSAKVTAELTACCIQVCMEGMLARSQFDSFFLFCFFVTLAQWIKDWWYNIVQQQAMFPREFLVLLLAGGSAHYLFFFLLEVLHSSVVVPYLLENSLTFHERSQHAYSPTMHMKRPIIAIYERRRAKGAALEMLGLQVWTALKFWACKHHARCPDAGPIFFNPNMTFASSFAVSFNYLSLHAQW